MSVKAWRELVTILTYEIGKPEKTPIFLEKRVYQESSGVALGYYGMGDTENALRYLAEVEVLDNNHQGIQQLRTLLNSSL